MALILQRMGLDARERELRRQAFEQRASGVRTRVVRQRRPPMKLIDLVQHGLLPTLATTAAGAASGASSARLLPSCTGMIVPDMVAHDRSGSIIHAIDRPRLLKNPPATKKWAESCPKCGLNGPGQAVDWAVDHLYTQGSKQPRPIDLGM
jgi:hypothetical protein